MKSIDTIIKKTAFDLNLPEDQVKILVKQYWETLYKGVTKVNGRSYFVRGVGTFTISKYKLDGFIRKRIYKIRSVKVAVLDEKKKTKRLELHYSKLKIALYYRNELAKQYLK